MSWLGLAALDLLLLAAGMALLAGLGLVRSAPDSLRHLGLAFVLGWAVVGIAVSTALVAGAPFGVFVVAATAVLLVAAGLPRARRIPGRRLPALGEAGTAAWIAFAGAAVVFVQLAALLRRALSSGAPTEWDAWAFWLPKARALVEFGGLDTGEGGFTSFAHPQYPPLVPVLEGSVFAFTGGSGAGPLALQHWLVLVAFLAALASVLAPRVRPVVLWPSLALLSVLPVFTALIGSSLGDEPLILLVGLGGACAAMWLLEQDSRYAVLAGAFLAAAALAKNEGLPIALALAGTMLLLCWRRPLVPALVLLAPVAAAVPWKLWLRANDVVGTPDYRLSDLLNPSLLSDRLDRLEYAADELPAYLLEPDRWLLAVPLMVAAAGLAAQRRPSLVVLALLPVLAIPAGLLLVYWIGYPPVDWYVATSAGRGVAASVVLAAVFLPLLVSEALRE